MTSVDQHATIGLPTLARRRLLALAAAAALAQATAPARGQVIWPWDNTTGNWSDPAHWGQIYSDPSNELRFWSGEADYVSTFDLPTGFELNYLQAIVDPGRTNAIVAAVPGRTIDFAPAPGKPPLLGLTGGGTLRVGVDVRVKSTLALDVAAGSNLVFAASATPGGPAAHTLGPSPVGITRTAAITGGGTVVWQTATLASVTVTDGLLTTDADGDFLGASTGLTIGTAGTVDTGGFADAWASISGPAGGRFRGEVNVSAGSYAGAIDDRPGPIFVPGFGLVGAPASPGAVARAGSGTLTLTGASGYTGPTRSGGGGVLAITGPAGRLSATSGVVVDTGGTFRLDGGAVASVDRLPDATSVRLDNGTLAFAGSAGVDSFETVGAVDLAGLGGTITVTPGSGRAATLTIGSAGGTSLTQAAGTTVTFAATGTVVLPGATPAGTGGLGGWAFLGPPSALAFAELGPGNIVRAVTPRDSTDATTWGASEDIRVAGSIVRQPGPGQSGARTLTLAYPNTLNLSGTGQPFTLAAGGILAQTSASIVGGTLQPGSGTAGRELVVAIPVASSTLTIGSVIRDNGSDAAPLTKVGQGSLVLTADNTYTGTTFVNAGTLSLGSNTPSGSVAGDLVVAGNVTVDRSGDLTYTRRISGPGSLTKRRAGTLVLGATNGYAGGPRSRAGPWS